MAHPLSGARWRDRLILGVGFALQGGVLAWLLDWRWALIGLGAGLAAAAPRRVSATLACCSLGGLGMLLGSWADVRVGAGLPACHLAGTASAGVAPWASFMFWGMLAGCLPACALGCAHPRRALILSHLGMILGMFAGGRALGGALGALAGSAFAGAHLAMLLGMGAGTAAGLGLAAARAPSLWRSRAHLRPAEPDRASASGQLCAVERIPCTKRPASGVH